jgi:hypothetical protein
MAKAGEMDAAAPGGKLSVTATATKSCRDSSNLDRHRNRVSEELLLPPHSTHSSSLLLPCCTPAIAAAFSFIITLRKIPERQTQPSVAACAAAAEEEEEEEEERGGGGGVSGLKFSEIEKPGNVWNVNRFLYLNSNESRCVKDLQFTKNT